ncbi:MAG: DUF362 domain-containing protein [Kiritimatiellia bacterium]|jgi:uncharacterized Fe-S center protein
MEKTAAKKPSTVYFTSMRTQPFGTGLAGKLEALVTKAGIGKIDFDNRFVAIKIHFGERGNLAFLRPNFARTVADKVKSLGGKPFLTDCNTLYTGSRKDALEHLETAWLNGFGPYVVGCPILIADGLRGTDDVAVPIQGGELLQEARIGRAVMDADIIVSLNHFKGHEAVGFGGAVKNLGMGCGSRAGKMAQHHDGKVGVNRAACIGCGRCALICAHGAPVISKKKCTIDPEACVGCGRCIGVCPTDAISPVGGGQAQGLLDKKIAEYAKAVVQDRPSFHINLVMDVSPNCDCHCENDAAVVPDLGFFASFDPVAVDQACVDAVNAAPAIRGSALGDSKVKGRDNLGRIAPATDWSIQLAHAEKIGIGTRQYKLVAV